MKKFIAILIIFCITLSCMGVFAEDTGRLITEVYTMTGKLFYCDYPTNRVVIKSVAPTVASVPAVNIAREAEYLEINVAPDGLRMNDGTAVKVEDLNIYTDSDVWFVIVKSADGNLSIPYLHFK